MNFPRLRARPWLAAIGCVAVGIIAASAAFNLTFFSDRPARFQINAAQVVAVPLALLAVAIGAIIRAAWIPFKPTDSRLTVRGMMLAVALLGSWLGTARWWVDYNFATVYASGYDEGRFRRLRIGMTTKEVGSILGEPIRKDSTSQRWAPLENWIYSEPPPPGTIGDNYWRRWVMFDGGKVAAIVDDYYVD